jgi:hypothetical protein
MVVHAYNPTTQEAEEGDCKFEASVGYTRQSLKEKKKRKDDSRVLGPCNWEDRQYLLKQE